MRFVNTATPDGGERLGVLAGDEVRLLDTDAGLADLLGADALAAAGRRALDRPDGTLTLAEARLLAPLPNPPTVRDFMTFESHTVGGMGGGDVTKVAPEWFEIPTFYFTNPYAIRGPLDDVPIPPGSTRFDLELEVAAVIGTPGENLTVTAAGRHIAGFCIFVDWSARDIQRHEMRIGLGPAKGKDTASSLGSIFVTADELAGRRSGHSYDLNLEVLRNGELFGADSLANMAWSFEELVAYASRGTSVRTGDLLGSGTCGNGCLGELWGRYGPDAAAPLQVGEVIETRAGPLGFTRNTIVAGDPLHPVPPARRLVSAAGAEAER